MDSQNLIDLFSLKLDNASKRHFPVPTEPGVLSPVVLQKAKTRNLTNLQKQNKPLAINSTNDGEDHSAVVNVEDFPSLVINGGSM